MKKVFVFIKIMFIAIINAIGVIIHIVSFFILALSFSASLDASFVSHCEHIACASRIDQLIAPMMAMMPAMGLFGRHLTWIFMFLENC